MNDVSDGTNRLARYRVLAAAFLCWMFAGLEISLFILIHRSMMLDLLRPSTGVEADVKEWFAWFQAAFLFGAAAGGWLLGWFGDRVGRSRALALSVLCYSLFTLACYFVADVRLMLALRFLACLGIGGTWPNAVALASEAWPDASRPLLAGLLGAAANVGFVLLGAIGFFVEITPQSWRWVLLVGAAPAVLGVACLVVPESARWLTQRRKSLEAGTRNQPMRELLQAPLAGRLVLGVLLGAIPVVGTAANANWLVPWTDHVAEQKAAGAAKPDARAKATTQMLRSGGAIFGSLLGGALATMLGRQLTYFLISLLSLAASTYIFGWLTPEHPQFNLFSFVMGLVGVIYFGWLPLYLPELFPTRVRATGTGISFNSGRIVAGFVVLAAGLLLTQFGGDYARIGLWTGMIYAAGMVIILVAPNTRDARLED